MVVGVKKGLMTGVSKLGKTKMEGPQTPLGRLLIESNRRTAMLCCVLPS